MGFSPPKVSSYVYHGEKRSSGSLELPFLRQCPFVLPELSFTWERSSGPMQVDALFIRTGGANSLAW